MVHHVTWFSLVNQYLQNILLRLLESTERWKLLCKVMWNGVESEDFTLLHRFLVIPPGFLMDSMDSMWNLWNYVEYVESTWNLWGSVKYTGGGTEMPNIGWKGVRSDPKKKLWPCPNWDYFQAGRLRKHVHQFLCSSECVVVIQVDFF